MEQHRISAEQQQQQQSAQAARAKPSPAVHQPLQMGQVAFDPWRRVYAPWMAEFLGTMLFVFFSDLLGTLLLDSSQTSLLWVDVAMLEAALLLGLMLAFGPFSGGHFNPAITLGSVLSLGTPLLLGFSLLLAQFFGAFSGALLFRSTVSNSAFLDCFSRLGVLRVLPSAENGEEEDLPRLVTNGLGRDGQGLKSPFASRLQVFLLELLLSALLVLAFLFPALLLPRPKILSASLSSASARAIATALGSRSPLGQSANLARALANSLLAAIFTRADEFAVWRLFHLHLFGAICSAIVGAAIFWLFKYAMSSADRAEVERHLRAEMQAVGGTSTG